MNNSSKQGVPSLLQALVYDYLPTKQTMYRHKVKRSCSQSSDPLIAHFSCIPIDWIPYTELGWAFASSSVWNPSNCLSCLRFESCTITTLFHFRGWPSPQVTNEFWFPTMKPTFSGHSGWMVSHTNPYSASRY